MKSQFGDVSVCSVSAVISTYNSPEKLRVALKSIFNQTRPVDEILVVGDGCSGPTASEIHRLGATQIRYVNLPFRCGEQAIPNAVGTILSKSKYVAYLNHDDLWLPRHLEEALAVLSSEKSPWFLGAAAFSDEITHLNGRPIPIFGTRTDPNRSVGDAYSKTHLALEPASSWVIDRSVVLRAGNWRPAWQMARTPASELALRIMRTNGEPTRGRIVTVAKVVGNRQQENGPHYFHTDGQFTFLEELIDSKGQDWPHFFSWPDAVSTWRTNEGLGFVSVTARFERLWRSFSKLNLRLYRLTGIDGFEYLLRAKVGRGTFLRNALRRRTGEGELARHTVASAIRKLGF